MGNMTFRSPTVGLLIVAVGLAASPSSEASQESVAILSLQALGTEGEIAESLEKFLYAEVQRLKGVTLQPKQQTVQKLAALPEAEQECDGDTKCLLRMGKACGVNKLLFGTVASLGESYVLDLKLIDVRRGKEVDRQSVTLSGKKEIMIDGVRAIATQMLAPAQFVGSLELRLDKPGAEIFVDGELVGKTPLKRIDGIKPGKHGLKIVLTGYRDFDRFVEVRFARVTIVNVSLSGDAIDAVIEAAPVEVVEPTSAPVVETTTATPGDARASQESGMSPLAVAGVGVAALGVGLLGGGVSILAGMYMSMAPHVDSENEGLVTDPQAYATLQDAYGWWPAGWALVGLGGASLVAGVSLAVVGAVGDSEEASE